MQKQAVSSKYSYTLYDDLGRIMQVGEITGSTAMSDVTSKDDGLLRQWLADNKTTKTQITQTVYDTSYGPSLQEFIVQKNLRNRVSWTALYNTFNDLQNNNEAGQASATFFTYDIHGNVDTLLQDYNQGIMQSANNRFKKIVYRYDLISGKVNYVIYQPGEVDAFYHHYLYDAENRITSVETSKDSIYWESDARYQYYKHGPLARTVLGQQQVQGLDYIYTLQGWLKAINPVAPLLGGSNGSGEGCGEGTAVNELVVNTRLDNTSDKYTARELISFEEGFENGNDDYFDAVIDETLATCNKTGSNNDGCGNGTAINDIEVNTRVNNTPDEYISRETINFNEGFENGYNDYFDATVDESLLPCKAAGSDYYATTDGTSASPVAKDAYNIVLNYYNNDYKGIDFPSPSLSIPTQLGSDFRPLYNGNISSMGVNVDKLNNPLLYNYQYDQLNRLVKMDAWQSSGTGWGALTKRQDFAEAIVYDPNGNILSYNRNGNNMSMGSPLAMDNLTYNYNASTNKLNYIHDDVPDANYTQDIDNQTANNYDYDEIGNLVKDNKEGISSIEWTVYGKISKITKNDGTTINYTYDASGNRISKAVTKNSITTTTWYVRDASGNVMSVYMAGDVATNSGHLTQSEMHLYGSSRLGIKKDSIDMQNIPSYQFATLADGSKAYNYIFTRGKKFFELSNHLGNVLVTVSDKKIGINDNNDDITDYYTADVVGANDYYPFGMIMPGRTFTGTTQYRYGFNGKENDSEVKGVGNWQDYGMRMYDPRIVRFPSVDPLTKKYPYYSPYQFAGNSAIKFVDLDGLEPGINQPTNNKELKGKEGRMWAVNLAFDKTGGEDAYSISPVTETVGTYATTVDKTKFFANNDNQGLNRTVNENSQFIVTDENSFKTDKDLVNNMLGNFLWGIGPENYVFPENGKFATELKGSIAVGETLVQWAKNNYKDNVYGWHMDLRGEVNVDVNSGFTSLEHFLGGVSVKIGKVDDQTIKLEIFNVTSLTSGDFNKDLFGMKALKSSTRDGTTHTQTDHSNISQYFTLTISTSEADKLIKQFNGGDLPVKK